MERPLQEQRGLYSMGLSPSCGLPAFTSMVPAREESRKDGILGGVQTALALCSEEMLDTFAFVDELSDPI